MNYTDYIAKLFGTWASDITVWSILLRCALSLGFAFLVGCERSTKGHTAGLKTFLLLSLTSTSCMLLDKALGATFPVCSAASIVGAAILSGNSVLWGAKNQLKGLTTSGWLWACGIFGLIVGAGLYTPTVILIVVYAIILEVLPAVEKRLKQHSTHFEIHVELLSKNDLNNFMTTLRRLGISIDDVEINLAFINSGLAVYSMRLSIVSKELKKMKTHEQILEALKSIDYVSFAEEIG